MSRSERADPLGTPGLLIDIAEDAGEVLLGLVGELGIYTTGLLHHDLEPFERPGVSLLVIDLSGISFLDSAGLGALVGARTRLGRAGVPLGLVCPRRVRTILRAGGVASAFVMGEDLACVREALAHRSGTSTQQRSVPSGAEDARPTAGHPPGAWAMGSPRSGPRGATRRAEPGVEPRHVSAVTAQGAEHLGPLT